eukprot:TRINITY_DN10197_c0_g1_i1.p1 TRINITY_DN10197_c0_g1~~TRINITY_DN10197_c0_g1_i1.p1  ORF type:complete len:100 (+),score=12.68 TRINITY_DN10197_c0_g1_i1:210-509(+)
MLRHVLNHSPLSPLMITVSAPKLSGRLTSWLSDNVSSPPTATAPKHRQVASRLHYTQVARRPKSAVMQLPCALSMPRAHSTQQQSYPATCQPSKQNFNV